MPPLSPLEILLGYLAGGITLSILIALVVAFALAMDLARIIHEPHDNPYWLQIPG